MTEPEVRAARVADIGAIEACLGAAYRAARARLADLPDVTGGIAEDLRDNLVRVVETGGQVVAVMVLVVQPDHVKLANIAVDPAHAGQGHAGRLMRAAEAISRALGRGEMRLVTHVGMPENVALYSHLGWQETARRENAVLMRKPL